MTPAGKACGRVLLAVAAFALLGPSGRGEANKVNKEQQQRNKQAEERLRRDVTFLASDECEGRGPTTQGLNKAAEYIAAEFKKAGLKPGFKGGYFQPFAVGGARGKLLLAGPGGTRVEPTPGVQLYPLGYNQKGKASGGVVFAGYGVTCKKPAYDDYAGIDVKGKVVVVLRDTPNNKAARESREMRGKAAITSKLKTAQDKGAVALLLVNDAETAGPKDDPPDFSYSRMSFGKPHLPSAAMNRSFLEKMLPEPGNLSAIEKGIDKDLKPNSVAVPGWTATLQVESKPDMIPLKNVVGVLEGAGPLAKETVVVGAHYDHLGYGGPSSAAGSKKRAIHHGADDNGSGTTALMELARRFAGMPNRQGRRLVFIAFSGEELGLFGSAAYCKDPIYPLADTASMFNLDMVGRLRNDPKTGKGRILTEGHGTAKPFKELIDDLAKKHDFTLASKASGFGPSDHASFCGKKIPVLFFWTGNHADYHKPTDTADRINVPGMRRVVDMSEEAVAALTKMEKPAYVVVKGTPGPRPSGGPRLGIRPGYGDDKDGVEVEGVSPGGVADKAGVKEGDVIIGLAGKPVKDIGTYMQAMSTQKKGNTIEVLVLRKGKKVTLKAKLE
jgi:hypothetical protein